MLIYRTVVKKFFSEFDSIIMQNLSNVLLLLCRSEKEKKGLKRQSDRKN